MKNLIFDSGPIISLAMARLLWILEPLKEKYGGKFYITPAVKRELVEHPLKIRRFEFEALQTYQLIKNNTLKIIDNKAMIINALNEVLDSLDFYQKHKSIYKTISKITKSQRLLWFA